MALKVSESGGQDFKQPTAGTHVARCIRIIDLGIQPGEWKGKPIQRHQILVTWELPNELMDDGRPFVVSRFYTASLSEKANLRKDLEAWRNRAFTDAELESFDTAKILGQPCMLSLVAKKDSNKVKVGTVMALPKGTQVPPATNDVWAFDLDDYTQEQWNSLSPGIKAMIENRIIPTPEAHDAPPAFGEDDDAPAVAGLDSDVPF
jgi:hypothetical protein